jgi:hypothetical protein
MTNKYLISLFFLLLIQNISAQVKPIDIYINHKRIDTTNSIHKEIVNNYSEYFTCDTTGKYKFKHWNQREIDNWTYDISRQHILFNYIRGSEKYVELTLVSLDKIGINKYLLKSMVTCKTCKPENRVFAIHNVVFIKENNNWVMENYINHYKRNWKHKPTKYFDYHFSDEYQINQSKIDSANIFIESVYHKMNFPIPEKKIEYIIANDFDEFSKLHGFDYFSFQFTTGTTAAYRGSITTMIGPFHAHEIVHLALKGKKVNYILNEGFADYLGSKIQFPKRYSSNLKSFKKYLKDNPDIDLLEVFKGNVQIPWLGFSYKYVLGAWLCEYIVDKYGFETLKQIINLNTWKIENLFEAISAKTNTVHKVFMKEFRRFILTN